MKDTMKHYELTIIAQTEQINKLMEERDILKRELKSSIATTRLLWDMLQNKGRSDAC